MGYESKIIVVERHVHDNPDGGTWVYGSEIARFDLSKMGYEQVWGQTSLPCLPSRLTLTYTTWTGTAKQLERIAMGSIASGRHLWTSSNGLNSRRLAKSTDERNCFLTSARHSKVTRMNTGR